MAGILHFTPDKKERLLPAINDWFSKAGENEVGVLIICASANTPTVRTCWFAARTTPPLADFEVC